MKETKQTIQIEGEILDTEDRKLVSHGDSRHHSIPKKPLWNELWKTWGGRIYLVKDHDGEIVLVIRKKPQPDGVTQ